jgi:hypothetical protein
MQVSSKIYQQGIKIEKKIIQEHGWKFSTREENIYQDIDAWNGDIPISIKYQPTAQRTGNLSLEARVLKVPAYTKSESLESLYSRGLWIKSWYHKSQAKFYLFSTGQEEILVDSQLLKQAITSGSIPHTKSWGNRWATVEKQFSIGHRHLDARNILVKVEDLKALISTLIRD